MLFDLRRDETCLAVGIIGLIIKDPFAARIRRPELLLLLIYVVLDDRVAASRIVCVDR